jgi:2-polyprenyl-6-methoxyphenol hydroxylase-like FAD-dependent oxidoreductase
VTSNALEADVIIVGAGPVGLCLALDLHARGISVLVLEKRNAGDPPDVKCNHIAARTMEQFRRLRFVEKIRAVGLTPEYTNDIAFRTTMTGIEFARIHIPGRNKRYTDRSGPDGWWPTPEPPHRSNQIYFEPVLLEEALSRGIRVMHGVEVTAFAQDALGVTVMAPQSSDRREASYKARFLVGCDGGRSLVRKGIGASFVGDAVVQPTQSTYIRAPGLLARMGEPAWCNYAVNPRRCATVFAIDGRETWLIHNYLNPGETLDDVDRNACIRTILGVEADFHYEILSTEDWVGRRLVADKLRDRRAFICGDAAHLWVPYAGYGMNAGIADAMNLSWHLSSHLHGWAAAEVLDAYELERHPITEQVSRFAMGHAQAMIKARLAVNPRIEEMSDEGQRIREATGRAAYELNVQQYCCAGLNFGYYYDRSPLIAYDGEAQPPYTMSSFTPSTVPGCRAPHFWLRDGRSLYDAFGPGYTLLRFDPSVDIAPLQRAAAAAALPLEVLDLAREDFPAEYRHKLLLARADQHIAWRGDAPPRDAEALIQQLSGRRSASAAAPA